MAIISKPNPVLKGQDNLFTLFKSELVNNFVVSSDVYFSDFSNWMSVNLNYQSTEGNQKKVVTFTHTDNFAPSSFYASPRARDSFSIMFIEIVDFDGEILVIPRSALNTLELDINLTNSDSDELSVLLENGTNFLLESGENLILE
jgi:hypothetical protein